jgi:Fur family ferric uptake transcriptional regulator
MNNINEKIILENHIRKKGLRRTSQRYTILKTFLETEEHVDVESLYNLVAKKDPNISLVTVYRTLKLLCECGLAVEMNLGKGITRYEHKYNHKHHDHLLCISCGKIIEFCSERIEEIQEEIAKMKRFKVIDHHLEITGICKECKKKGEG